MTYEFDFFNYAGIHRPGLTRKWDFINNLMISSQVSFLKFFLSLFKYAFIFHLNMKFFKTFIKIKIQLLI